MPSNGRQHRQQRCTVCELSAVVLEDLDARMSAGQRNSDITRWMRSGGFRPVPTATMLNRHRSQLHYRGDRTTVQTSDSTLAGNHRDGLNLMQRVQLNVAHVLLPRLALAPKVLNIIEEKNELYAFTKNQLAIEFEIAQNTPEVYEHPITGDTQLITPTSPSMLKLVKELRHQLDSIEESTKNTLEQADFIPELVTRLMSEIKGEGDVLEELEKHMYQVIDIVADEADEADEGKAGS